MLDANIKNQLQACFEKLVEPIELVATLDGSDKSHEMREMLAEIAALSGKVSLLENGSDARKPSFSVSRPGAASRIRFAGIPMGHEFTSLVLALLQTGGQPFAQERLGVAEILAKLDTGAAAAVYAARFGGQVLDTLGIENLISVTHTEGPKLGEGAKASLGAFDYLIRSAAPAAERP